jgi:integrase
VANKMSDISRIPNLDDFMRNYAPRSGLQVKARILEFYKWAVKKYRIKSILDVKYNMVLEFFKGIDIRDLRENTKSRYRYALYKYFEYNIEYNQKMELPIIQNPVPSELFFRFSNEKDRRTQTFSKKYMTYFEIEKILKFSYFTNFQMFIFFGLIAYTGARPSEIASIQKADLDLKERKFISGRSINYSKRGLVLFFWPKFFTQYLLEYLSGIVGPSEFLFPAKYETENGTGFMSTTTFWKWVGWVSRDVLKLNIKITPRMYRDAINSERKDKGVDLVTRQYLVNQEPDSVNESDYLKRFENWEWLRNKYDQTIPYPIFQI